jgi:biotin-dependent carboxylase-like uncharacterized protein
MITVLNAGLDLRIQDEGRVGSAHLGIPRSGAWDRAAYELGNRLVGNHPEAAVLEAVCGQVALRTEKATIVAVTGVQVAVTLDGRPVPVGVAAVWPAGGTLQIGSTNGTVTISVAGGIDVPREVGSRSCCALSGLGPDPLYAGQTLPVGSEDFWPVSPYEAWAKVNEVPAGVVNVPVHPLRAEFASLTGHTYRVAEFSRVGVRLAGPAVLVPDAGSLPTTGIVRGAIQIPADGQPIVLGPDHGVTGGYPVVGVVDDPDRWAHLLPGREIRFVEVNADAQVQTQRVWDLSRLG